MRDTLQDAIHNWQADEGQTEATMLTGQLEFIAEELRTANMIALANAKWAAGVGWPSVEKLAKAIDERLGLS